MIRQLIVVCLFAFIIIGCDNLGSIEYPDTSDIPFELRPLVEQAKSGVAFAQFQIGTMYENGEGVGIDIDRAIFWYELAAKQGYSDAQFNLGNMYQITQNKNEIKSAYWFERAADNGDVEAQYNISLLYMDGIGIKKDLKKSFEWMEKAAKNNYANAQYNLGVFYADGVHVKKDAKEAFKWFSLSAEQGEPSSQFSLGKMYLRGEGTEKDLKKSYIYLRLSERWYPEYTQELLAQVRPKLTKQQLIEADKYIEEWNNLHPRNVVTE